jgi:hypothetical protein
MMKNIPERHFLLKVPRNPAYIVAAPDVKEPWIGQRQLQTGLQRVYADSFYFPRDASVIEVEAQEPPQQKTPASDPEQTPPAAVHHQLAPPRSGGNADNDTISTSLRYI